jgi:hypothetical protein
LVFAVSREKRLPFQYQLPPNSLTGGGLKDAFNLGQEAAVAT